MPRPALLGYLNSAIADNTGQSAMDKLLFEDEMSNIQPEWGTMREEQEGYDPVMEFAEGMIPIGGVLKSLKGVKGSRTLLDDALSKYGKKAHNQIRELIDYDRAIAMDIPEKSHFLQRGISRMFRVVEPDKKKVQRLEDLWTMEDWEEFTEPLMKRTSNLLKGKGTKGMQQGGPAERAPLLGYMNPAVQDETAHDSMDRLMFENELEQQPQHSMRTYQQGYDPAMEWGEGMMPIGGALRLLKGTKDYSKMLKQLSKVADREKKTYEVFEDAARKHGPKIDAGGADKAGKDYLTTKWIQRLLQ